MINHIKRFYFKYTIIVFLMVPIRPFCQESSDSLRKYSYILKGFLNDSIRGKTTDSQGSGFFIRDNGKLYLVTARHIFMTFENCVKDSSRPYIITIPLHDEFGNSINEELTINIKAVQDTLKCFSRHVTPDCVIYPIIDSKKRFIFSVEKLLPVRQLAKYGTVKMYGFPRIKNTGSWSTRHIIDSASKLEVICRLSSNFGFVDKGVLGMDHINYLIVNKNKNITLDSSKKGFSGSPVFFKKTISNNWVFIGVANAVDPVINSLFVVRPRFILGAAFNQY